MDNILGGRSMGRKSENSGFSCINCNESVLPLTNGSHRNHCPFCLYSKHVDEMPGDRSSKCLGLMKPIDLIYHTKKGYRLLHQCLSCYNIQRNRIARDTLQEDDINRISMITQTQNSHCSN
ncbi:RNHCP domain-containing protein [Shouchella patagoniensis]|uniref:RNHCP domain-containing protein n=1 Tax=Shouchella patagoniensis TaxID=228576 RepID=UPI000994D63C